MSLFLLADARICFALPLDYCDEKQLITFIFFWAATSSRVFEYFKEVKNSMCSWTAAESDMVVKNRLVGFLLWQSILCTFVFLVFTAVIATWRSLAAISISFFSFHLSQLLFSVSLSTVLSTQHKFRLNLLVLLAVAAVSGYLSALSLCGVNGRVGFKGFASGSFYAFFYVWKRRWVLQFPIIQVN